MALLRAGDVVRRCLAETLARRRQEAQRQQDTWKLWARVLDSRTFPSDDEYHALVGNLQLRAIRDRLIGDITARTNRCS